MDDISPVQLDHAQKEIVIIFRSVSLNGVAFFHEKLDAVVENQQVVTKSIGSERTALDSSAYEGNNVLLDAELKLFHPNPFLFGTSGGEGVGLDGQVFSQ